MTSETTATAPLVLFAYKRPRHLRQVIEALQRNRAAASTALIAFSDGPAADADLPAVEETRRVLDEIRGFRDVEVVSRPENLGLARSVIDGVSQVVDRYGEAIVVEDDLVVSPTFLDTMNRLLRAYADCERVFSITGYNYPQRLLRIPADYPYSVYFSYRASSWGWATWRDRWRQVDWSVSDYAEFAADASAQRRFARAGEDLVPMLCQQMNGQLDSWAVRWCYSAFRLDKLNVYPVRSLLTNIGLDASGVHCVADPWLDDQLDPEFPRELALPPQVEADALIMNNLRLIFASDTLSRIRRKLRDGLLPVPDPATRGSS